MDANAAQEQVINPPTLAQMINTGFSLHKAGNLAEAKNIYLEVLASDPENFDALHLLGVLALQFGNHELAVDLIEKAVRQHGGNAIVFNNLGEAYKGMKRLDQAERCYRKALEIDPNFAEVCSNLGNALKGQGRLEDAAESYRRALAIKPQFMLVHYNLGSVLKELGELQEARASFAAALALKPDFADAAIELAKLQLLLGDYEQGQSYFQQRMAPGDDGTPARRRECLQQLQGEKLWQGEALEGHGLLLVCEQGAGDNIMMMRYLPLVAKRGPDRLLVYATPHLARLFQQFGGIEVIPMTEPPPTGAFDLCSPLMNLPALFQTNLKTIPSAGPYLRLAPEVKEHWRARLGDLHGVRVGLCWAVGRLSATATRRSIALETLLPLLDVRGLQWVNLQKGTQANQLQAVAGEFFDCMNECGDLLDTAGVIGELDLVITADTSIAHLAGAMGRPVWLLNCFQSDWRWMMERSDSPWYPSMRIFRQTERGSWDGVVRDVAEQLALFAALAA